MLQLKTYNNYRELCREMNWEAKGGNYKQARLRELESICKYHREGRKFCIEQIYDKPIEIKDDKNDRYAQAIQALVYDMCSLNPSSDVSIILPYSDLMTTFNFVNEAYNRDRYNVDYTAKEHNTNKVVVYDVFNNSYRNFMRAIRSALAKITNNRLIRCCDTYMLIDKDGNEKPLTFKTDGSIISKIIDYEDKALTYCNPQKKYNNLFEVILSHDLDLYYGYVIKQIQQNIDSKVVRYKRIYYCICSEEYIKNFKQYQLENEERICFLSTIRERANISAMRSAERRYKKAIKLYKGIPNPTSVEGIKIIKERNKIQNKIRKQDYYIEDCRKIINSYMPINKIN